MRNKIATYLESRSFTPLEVNRLIVSNFLISNNISDVSNHRISSLIIEEVESEDWAHLTNILEISPIRTIEDLVKAFEYVISPEDRVISGAIYTPTPIRDFILDQTFNDLDNLYTIKVCDPACGCASFLYSACLKIHDQTGRTFSEIYRDNIFGLDIQGYSVERSKILLALAAILNGDDQQEYTFNLFNGNALDFNWFDQLNEFEGFDAIVGNPPYVCSRNIDEESKGLLENWSVCSTGHPDLYIPFFELGIDYLKEGGFLGYITMNTFFKSINGRALREYLSQFDNSIIDFGGYQVFDSKSTYTCICLIRKQSVNYLQYTKLNSVESLQETIEYNRIDFELLDHFDGWNLQEIQLLNRIENAGTPLGKKFKTRNGIATLKNNIYIFNPIDEDEDYYYLQNGKVYQIEKELCADIVNSNKFTKIESVDSVRQKVIFPYRYDHDEVQLIDERELSSTYPRAYKYLKDKRKILATRDKGKGKYEKWYAYGRNQSLEKMQYKLFFPHISAGIPNFVVNQDERLLFYNGLALIAENQTELLLMKKLMGSRLFWFYVTKSSKPYGSGYYSLSRNYIKKFGIPEFTEDEIDFVINQDDQEALNEFIDNIYGINTEVLV